MIGQTVWFHDGNYRVYQDDSGAPSRTANKRLMYRPVVITGETAQSWTITSARGDVTRINKKTREITGAARRNPGLSAFAIMSEKEVDDAVFIDEQRHEISSAILRCDNADILRRIKAILDDGADNAC